MFIWKEEYCIGVELIDKQHKYMFEIGNNAYKLLNKDSHMDRYEDVILLIQDLNQYAKFHFHTEEEYMLKINYNEYLDQCLDHERFIKMIDEMNLEKVDEDIQKHIEVILEFIFTWLIEHILKKDKLMKVNEISLF